MDIDDPDAAPGVPPPEVSAAPATASGPFLQVWTQGALWMSRGEGAVVSPRGGILLCEDGNSLTDVCGPGTQLIGITLEGDSYPFAKNNISLTLDQVVIAGKRIFPGDYRGGEWADACFDPDGEVLFVNIQSPGITFAISGPWERGNI